MTRCIENGTGGGKTSRIFNGCTDPTTRISYFEFVIRPRKHYATALMKAICIEFDMEMMHE